jgi:hypothetical protein
MTSTTAIPRFIRSTYSSVSTMLPELKLAATLPASEPKRLLEFRRGVEILSSAGGGKEGELYKIASLMHLRGGLSEAGQFKEANELQVK